MHHYLETVAHPQLSTVEEDKILAEMERMVNSITARMRRTDDVTEEKDLRPVRKRFPFVIVTAIVIVGALVPVGLMKSDWLAKAAHQVASE